jgi:hypothetical protein
LHQQKSRKFLVRGLDRILTDKVICPSGTVCAQRVGRRMMLCRDGPARPFNETRQRIYEKAILRFESGFGGGISTRDVKMKEAAN